MSSYRNPPCHLAHLPGPRGQATHTAVWICEYPYPTMRSSGPSAECGDCPVWRAIEARTRASELQPDEDVRQLELMLGR